MTTYHLPTGHKREEEQADCRFIRCENDQQTPDPVVDALRKLGQATAEYPADLLRDRRAALLAAYRNLATEQQRNVTEELAEIEVGDAIS